jgi:hypothetical protein
LKVIYFWNALIGAINAQNLTLNQKGQCLFLSLPNYAMAANAQGIIMIFAGIFISLQKKRSSHWFHFQG